MKKRIAIFGSTGSIGQQTLEVVRALPDKLEVVALTARSQNDLFEKQVQEFSPKQFFIGEKASPLEEIAAHDEVDVVVVATSGSAGLRPTMAAIQAKKTVALANKEVLVMAGAIVMQAALNNGAEIKPVDSEHSAIWQCLQGEPKDISQIILTASGGAFRDRPLEDLADVTAAEALDHPTWTMGPKVTVDSANLMNKGMEVIEAHWLFDVPYDRIKVMIQPGSIVHSMVEFTDGSVKAQLGVPDMRLPIQYALSHPERWENSNVPKLDFNATNSLNFASVDMNRYPCLRLAFEAGIAGGTCPAVLSAADEVAVELFLSGKIGFLDIPRLLEDTLGRHRVLDNPMLSDILAVDEWARLTAGGWCSK